MKHLKKISGTTYWAVEDTLPWIHAQQRIERIAREAGLGSEHYDFMSQSLGNGQIERSIYASPELEDALAKAKARRERQKADQQQQLWDSLRYGG